MLLLIAPEGSHSGPVPPSHVTLGGFPRHVSSSPSTSHGLCHKSATSNVVGICLQLKMCSVLRSLVSHRGQSGEMHSLGLFYVSKSEEMVIFQHEVEPIRLWCFWIVYFLYVDFGCFSFYYFVLFLISLRLGATYWAPEPVLSLPQGQCSAPWFGSVA